jgi:N-methylhydantoinase A
MSDIDERFHQLHEHADTFRLESPVELVNFHLTALGQVEKPKTACLHGATASSAAIRSVQAAHKGERQVIVDLREPQSNDGGFLATPIYERDLLPIGARLSGPLIVEEPAATTVVLPGQRLSKDEFGFLHIEEK